MLNGTSFCDAKGSVLIIFKASKTMIADRNIPPHGTIEVDHLTFAATEKQIEWWRSKLEDCGAEIVNEIYRKNGATRFTLNILPGSLSNLNRFPHQANECAA